ncbi:MAG: hypothetical protein ABIZ80_04925, partial [Bryobacteraceae bacterium]
MSLSKPIRSRSNKNIGDVIEEKWEITGKTVIADPQPGDRDRGVAPRLGIYEYDVKPIPQKVPAKAEGGPRKQSGASVGGTRREASGVPL